ncbi:MAG: glycogen(starch) synthase, partial [Saprospiraceae bacterium]
HLVIPFKDETTPVIPNVTIYGLNTIEQDFKKAPIRSVLNKKTTILSFTEIHSYPLVFEEGVEYLETEEVEIIEEGEHKPFHSHLEVFNSPEMYGKGLWDKLPVYSEIVNEIAGLIDFDIVHCHDWVTFGAGKKIKATYHKPLCLHVHALETDRAYKTIRNDIYEIEHSAMQMADLIFPVSQYTKEQIIENYEISGDKIIPIYNAIDEKLIRRWKHKIPERIVTFLGRITAQKGPEYLFETAQKVVTAYPNVKFVIAGNGDQMAQLIAASADKQISQHFIFMGFVSREDVDALLATSDVYFMPSVSEPFGLTALEATRAGVPCVLTKQSGAAEVLPSALTADYWNTDLFAEHILKLLSNEDFRQNIIKENQKEMNKISWYASAARIVEEYAVIL